MKAEHRFPTILGLMIIASSLIATFFFIDRFRTYRGKASASSPPQEVKISNLSDTSFTVSWITSESVAGAVSFGQNSAQGNVASDDRDQVGGETKQYLTHHVTLKYLNPSSKYLFKIISGSSSFDNNGQDFIVTTAPKTTTLPTNTNPVFGTVKKPDNSPAAGAIVYLTLRDATLLSTLVKSSGSWLIVLNNARTADLSDFVKVNPETRAEIFVQAAADDMAQVTANLGENSPIPQIDLGKTVNLTQLETTPTTSPSPTSSPLPEEQTGPQPTSPTNPAPTTQTSKFIMTPATGGPSLMNPAQDANITSGRPLFRGTGVPGTTISIKIESDNPITTTANVDQNGNWTWTPPTGLPPGNHKVTVTATDANGKTVTFIRYFTVLASGTQVSEPATPSATLSPTPTPATAPASGNLSVTIFVFLSGLALITLGVGRFLFLENS